MRAFIAIELPPQVKSKLTERQQGMKKAGLNARWVRVENIHLTLKFLGEIDPDTVAAVSTAMKSAAESHGPFTLAASGIGVFPNLRKARVLWAGLSEGVPELVGLQKDLDAALAACGFERDKRAFRGHLTMARFRKSLHPAKLEKVLREAGGVHFGQWTVEELVLFRSELQPAGAIYTKLAAHPLRGQ
jgi:2'-5' RNA ligase